MSNKKIKILEIGMSNNIGGIETFLINLYRNMDRSKYQIDFLVDDINSFCFKEELLNHTKVIEFNNYLKRPLKFLRFFKQIVKENKYDIIHINKNSLANPLQLIAAKLAGANCIVLHSHSTTSNLGFVGKIMHKINKLFLLNCATHYFSCSKEASRWFFTKDIITSEKHFYINNAINLNIFKFDSSYREEIRKEIGLSKTDVVIGHVGRFVFAKNHSFLIDLFKYIHDKNNNFKLVLVGVGELLDDIIKKVELFNLMDSVYFLNNRDDVYKIYSAMDCFILPSLFEGLPIVGVEAQANGLECFFSNTIDNRVKISSHSHIVELSKGIEYWGSLILNNNLNINQNIDELTNSEFNVETEIKKIENIFLKIVKEDV